MTKLLLSLHVLAAILAIGPVTVAASMFPRYAGPHEPDGESTRDHDIRTAALLHRICRGYTVLGIAVPVFGLATGAQLGVLTDPWLLASIVLTGIAAAVLLTAILPGQQRLLDDPVDVKAGTKAGTDTDVEAGAETDRGTGTTRGAAVGTSKAEARRSAAARLSMTTGIFNLLWATVVVLMIVRPGSTTGV